MAVNTLPIGEKTRDRKYVLPSINGRDMLTWLKGLALEPCNMRPPHKKFQDQMLQVRELLNASAQRSQRKRKFMHENDSKLSLAFRPISREKYGHQNAKNQRRDGSYSISCSPLFKGKCDSIQGTQDQVAFRSLCRGGHSLLSDRAEEWVSLQGRAEYCSVCTEDYSQLRDFDESFKGPNPIKQGNLKRLCNFTHSSKTSIKEEPNTEIQNMLKSFVNEEFDNARMASHSLRSKKDLDLKFNRLREKFLPSRSSHLPRPVIPIGPRFQAEVSEWEGTTNIIHYNCDDLKWLGTQIWPLPEISETNTEVIGKGRPDSCSCDIPGSLGCVRKHVRAARRRLQYEIGPAFSSWKFDEMGEDVSKSWILKEQKEFESLARRNLQKEDTDFWKLAMKHFAAKTMKSMVNYYYNVYIPRLMGVETRSSAGELDSDNDQNKDYN